MSQNESTVLKKFVTSKNIIVLTGAGISAESGLPTFRGEDGYWVKNGKNFHPMELATNRAFREDPETVWEWYHYRRNLYSKTEPNQGHYALVELAKNLPITLVTQNVDRLHQKAGYSKDIFEIHGNIFYMRCFNECTQELVPIEDSQTGVPSCQKCGDSMRPHVLWMDEFYNEEYYKYNTVQVLGRDTMDALLLIGTTLQTNLPRQLFELAYYKQLPILDINPHPIGLKQYGTLELVGKSGEILPELVKKFSV